MAEHNTNNESEALLREKVAKQEYLINQMTIRCHALEFENKRFRLLLYNSWRNKSYIPLEEIYKYELAPMLLEEVMAVLQQSLYKFDFSTRVRLTFHALDICTVKDILVEFKEHKAYHLKCYRSFGPKALQNVYEVLYKNGILDKSHNSYLFDFV